MNWSDSAWRYRMCLIADGWRFCHNQSARKHRRQGHDVHYFGEREYRWRPRAMRGAA